MTTKEETINMLAKTEMLLHRLNPYCINKPFSTPLSLLIGRIHRAKKQCAARKQGNEQLQRPYDFLIEDLYSLLDDINSHLTEELQHEKNL
tara:strand:+ start:2595 stop:2867 length:273 start_codon:yes stop_codon:yes gene_type:complete